MILIIGGAYQGKTEYVKREYNIKEEDIFYCYEQVDMIHNISEVLNVKKCISGLQVMIKQYAFNGIDVTDTLEKVIAENPSVIITMDEVGLGIVPMEREVRDYREAVGHAGCYLARKAEKVTRIICGLPTDIK